MRIGTSAISCLVLAGCATVQTLPDRAYTGDPAVAVDGVSYALPVLQYTLQIERTLSACPALENATIKPPAFDLAVEANGEYLAGETYLVDYTKLGGPLKTSGFTLEKYPNGTLKSIGASADDQTGKALASAAKLVGSAVMLSTGVPFGPALAAATGGMNMVLSERSALRIVDCTEDAKAALETYTKRKVKLEEAGAAVDAANDGVERMAREIALKLADPDDAGTRARWKGAIAAQDAAVAAAAQTQKDIAAARKTLTVSETVRWPGSVRNAYVSAKGENLDASEATVASVFKLFEERALNPAEQSAIATLRQVRPTCHVVAEGTPPPQGSVAECLKKALPIRIEAKPVEVATQACKATETGFGCVQEVSDTTGFARATDLQPDGGIFYRDPMWAILWVCGASTLPEGGSCPATVEIANLTPVNFPQFGRLRFLPFRVPIFKQKDMKLDLDASGRMTYFHMKSLKAALAEAADTAQQTAATAATTAEAYETERRSDRDYSLTAATKATQAQIDEIEAKKKLTVVTTPAAPAAPGSPAELTARTADLNLQIALKKAELTQALLLAVNANDAAAIAQILALLK